MSLPLDSERKATICIIFEGLGVKMYFKPMDAPVGTLSWLGFTIYKSVDRWYDLIEAFDSAGCDTARQLSLIQRFLQSDN